MVHRFKPTPCTRGHRPSEGVGFTASCWDATPDEDGRTHGKGVSGRGNPPGVARCTGPRSPITRPQGRPEATAHRDAHTWCLQRFGAPQSGGPIPAPALPALVIDAPSGVLRRPR